MRIKNIYLDKFKRFDNLTIDLGPTPKKIVALVGPNGCGKSSIFDALLLLQNSYDSIGQFGRKDSLFFSKEQNIEYIIDLESKNRVKVDFTTGNFSSTFRDKSHTGDQKTIFSFRSSYRYSQNLNITSLTSLPDIKLNNVGASHSVDLDEKISHNYQRLHIYLEKYRKDHDLTDQQANKEVLGDLNKILKECINIEIVDLGNIMDSRGRLYFIKQDQSNKFDYNLLSAGEKEVVDILLDLFLKREVYSDSIYCIDEPELHLNTSIQRKLLLEIEKIIPENCQLLIATHSIGFLRALQEDLRGKIQVLDFSEKDYFSGNQIMVPIKPTRNSWQRIFRTALEDLTGLINPKKIIYCEGRKEPSLARGEQGLDADVYNMIFSENYPDILFISSGGGNEPQKYANIALSVLNKVFKDVELYLLKDKDDFSNQERNSFINQDQKRNRMLERREIENYLFDF